MIGSDRKTLKESKNDYVYENKTTNSSIPQNEKEELHPRTTELENLYLKKVVALGKEKITNDFIIELMKTFLKGASLKSLYDDECFVKEVFEMAKKGWGEFMILVMLLGNNDCLKRYTKILLFGYDLMSMNVSEIIKYLN